MLISRVVKKLESAPELHKTFRDIEAGSDVTLSAAQSVRSLIVAAEFAKAPRPTLVVLAGDEMADRFARALASWLGQEHVLRYSERPELVWSDKPRDGAILGARCACVRALATDENKVVVASARALMQRVPPKDVAYFEGIDLALGDVYDPVELRRRLLDMGYVDVGSAKDVVGPTMFFSRGDTLDVFPSDATSPVRIEFFGDEIDRLRKMLPATGQTLGDIDDLHLLPAREFVLDEHIINNVCFELLQRAKKALRASDADALEATVEQLRSGIYDASLEQYLPEMYGETASLIDHMVPEALVVLCEPRSLFDDCMHRFDELKQYAQNARIQNVEALYTNPRQMDFGAQQRLTFASMLRAGTTTDVVELKVEQPKISGGDTKLLARIRQFISQNYSVLFAVPDRGAREALEFLLTDEHVPFSESLLSAEENRAPLGDMAEIAPLTLGSVTFSDAMLPAGVVVPGAQLATLSVADLSLRLARGSKRKQRRQDPTNYTFPFKPGDYVVHATHGIALFADIVRQAVGGRERDYFLLEYADKDKLYVPLEQVDRITRYVGPDGSSPRLTRLNTADWSRATGKARKSAKKLAFDLVDLYTRRSSVVGYAFSPDTPEQKDMEASFGYTLTPDQSYAIQDIKADMEAKKPMDRLLCGDVGFGKTEVALRSAFKCCADGRQVMVLCPTTILAQQHFETFYKRFAPFEVKVRVLSRFVSTKEQKAALKGFAEGEVQVLIGTHRLLSADVNPKDLGLVIIDEEQRFGVQHKEQLKNIREQIDVLTLSATPIPRTMQMALSGVRDMSLILTPPPGRLPVKVVVGEWDPDMVSAAIRSELERGGQVYYVSNRVLSIDDAVSRVLEAAPEARVGVAHGQMSAAKVEDVMLSFAEGEIDVLVATTIIESGIDNPHTNTLIIEDSQRMGLAQLYQLKGRVGRGRTQAYAYFMFPPELPLTQEATERLTALSEFQELGSGMRIAMRDLEIRGAGSLMGAEQHGNLSSVGFDLFTQMLGEAVAEARGEASDLEQSEVTINLPADFYLAEEYVPDVDKRVLAYRKIASAQDLSDVDMIQKELEDSFGALPLAARNLLDRARLRIRASRIGVQTIMLSNGKIYVQGAELTRKDQLALKAAGCMVFATSKKFSHPYHASKEELLPCALGMLNKLAETDDEHE